MDIELVSLWHGNSWELYHKDCPNRPSSFRTVYAPTLRYVICKRCKAISNSKRLLTIVALLDMKYKRIHTTDGLVAYWRNW